MKKQIIFTLTAALFVVSIKAQYTPHEFSLYGAGGISSLQYKTTEGNTTPGWGGSLGIGYTYYFNPQWGIGTAVEGSVLNGKYKLDYLEDSYKTHDGSEDFILRYKLRDYQEQQRAFMLSIPLMLHFQTTGTTKFYLAAGGKVSFPLVADYKSTTGSFTTSAYYPQYNSELESPRFMGFGDFEGTDKKGSLKLKTVFSLSAEAGVKWKLNEILSIYTGAYIDYGLNNILNETQNNHLLIYNNQTPDEYGQSTVLASLYKQGDSEKTFTDKLSPLSAGIKITLAFGKTQKKKAAEETTIDTGEETRRREEEARLKQEEARQAAEMEKQRKAEEEKLRQQQAEDIPAAEKKKEYEQAIHAIEKEISGYTVGQTYLSNEKKAELNEKAMLLKEYPDMKIICIGHTCDIGTEEINMRVGMERAQAAKEYLIARGISAYRIEVQSKGSKEPLVPNNSEDNRKQNRRVEIIIPDSK